MLMILMLLIIIGFFTFIVLAVRYTVKYEQEIKVKGIETEGIVSRNVSRGPKDNKVRNCYITYIGDDGLEHEGLLNLSVNLPVGRKVKIKYLPPKYKHVTYVIPES